MHKTLIRILALAMSVAPHGALAQTAPLRDATALDQYVAAPDSNYRYTVINTIAGRGYRVHIVDMTSQAWRSPAEVDRPVWRHWVIVVRPDSVRSTKAMLFIGGSNNETQAPTNATQNLIQTAMATRSIVAEVRMIPNQPLKFAGDQQGRSEDDLIALTWARFIQGGDDHWPAQLPMAKAVVRAMDTVTSLCASEQGGRVALDGFVLVGASKRGWTAWAASAVDRRVIAVVPIVIDMLNIEPSFANHLAAYGYFSPAVRDYEGQGILNWRGTPRYAELMRVLDPYSFRSRVTIPKFLINAAGDQFFLPDSWQFYYHDLPGEKQLRYIPNADHGMAGTDVWMSVSLAYNAFITNTKLPRFDWRVERDGTIRVAAQDRPSAVKLWQITNPGSRDFRLSTIGARWTSGDLQEQGNGTWSAKVGAPPRGWTAYMIELTYPSGPMLPPHKFTTGIKVVPESLPFAEVIKPPAR